MGNGLRKLTDPSPILIPSSPTACLLQGQACTYPTPSVYTCNDKSPPFPASHLQLAPSLVCLFACLPCPAQVALAPIQHLSCCHCPACSLSCLQGVALLDSHELCSPFPTSCNADSSKEDPGQSLQLTSALLSARACLST